MKKTLIGVGIIMLAILIGVGAFIGWKKLYVKKLTNVATANTTQTVAPEQKQEVAKRPGEYAPYDVAKLAEASDGKVILFFCAKWSKTCKMLDNDFKANVAKFPNNFTILYVDYDKSTALKKQYQVPFEDTFVQVDAGGAMINKWSGSEDLAEVVALAK
ncbi:MAG: thioredoxin family protein [Candidatus Saccharibacteria bacterium]